MLKVAEGHWLQCSSPCWLICPTRPHQVVGINMMSEKSARYYTVFRSAQASQCMCSHWSKSNKGPALSPKTFVMSQILPLGPPLKTEIKFERKRKTNFWRFKSIDVDVLISLLCCSFILQCHQSTS